MKLISSLHNILSLSTSLRFPRATTHLRSMSTSYDAFRVKSHDGKVVRGKVCKAIVGEGKGHENVVMLHGWLDNSASFENFLSRAERFDSDSSSNASNSTRRTATFYAIDLPGHGRSDHLGGHTCVLAEYVAYVKDVVASVLRGDDDDDEGQSNDNRSLHGIVDRRHVRERVPGGRREARHDRGDRAAREGGGGQPRGGHQEAR